MSAALQQQIDSLLKRNQAARTQLLGTDYMPDLAPDTLTAGPKGIGENLANMFGLYDAQPKLEAILKERESRAAEYNKALKQLEKATRAEAKAEAAADRATVRAEDALDNQQVLDRQLQIEERLADRADQRDGAVVRDAGGGGQAFRVHHVRQPDNSVPDRRALGPRPAVADQQGEIEIVAVPALGNACKRAEMCVN